MLWDSLLDRTESCHGRSFLGQHRILRGLDLDKSNRPMEIFQYPEILRIVWVLKSLLPRAAVFPFLSLHFVK